MIFTAPDYVNYIGITLRHGVETSKYGIPRWHNETMTETSAFASSLPSHRPLGTPLGAHPTRVLFLGSGELGKEVTIELMRLGAWVCAA